MPKTKALDADAFTSGLLMEALANLKATRDPTTRFKAGPVEFNITLHRIDGKRVLAKTEALLVKRIEDGQSDLTPAEARMARRILARKG